MKTERLIRRHRPRVRPGTICRSGPACCQSMTTSAGAELEHISPARQSQPAAEHRFGNNGQAADRRVIFADGESNESPNSDRRDSSDDRGWRRRLPVVTARPFGDPSWSPARGWSPDLGTRWPETWTVRHLPVQRREPGRDVLHHATRGWVATPFRSDSCSLHCVRAQDATTPAAYSCNKRLAPHITPSRLRSRFLSVSGT